MAFLEHFAAWRLEGGRELMCHSARKADAFVILGGEAEKENGNG